MDVAEYRWIGSQREIALTGDGGVRYIFPPMQFVPVPKSDTRASESITRIKTNMTEKGQPSFELRGEQVELSPADIPPAPAPAEQSATLLNEPEEHDQELEELRNLAREAGIPRAGKKKRETLIAELDALSSPNG